MTLQYCQPAPYSIQHFDDKTYAFVVSVAWLDPFLKPLVAGLQYCIKIHVFLSFLLSIYHYCRSGLGSQVGQVWGWATGQQRWTETE